MKRGFFFNIIIIFSKLEFDFSFLITIERFSDDESNEGFRHKRNKLYKGNAYSLKIIRRCFACDPWWPCRNFQLVANLFPVTSRQFQRSYMCTIPPFCCSRNMCMHMHVSIHGFVMKIIPADLFFSKIFFKRNSSLNRVHLSN